MGSARVRAARLTRLAVAGLCCTLMVACGNDSTAPSDDDIPDLPGGDSPTFEDLFGTTLLKADGTQVGLHAVQDKPLVGLYFAAGWCPACAGFTPTLVSAYQGMQSAGKPFEIVLVGLDGETPDILAHMTLRKMPWLAVPNAGGRVQELVFRYGIEWIPTLVVIDAQRRIVTRTAREDVTAVGAAAYDRWAAAGG